MARVTVEDCVSVVNNRYDLVLLASQRARDIAAGMVLTVPRDNDKNTVVALREIAEQTVDLSELQRHIVRGVNRHDDLTLEDDTILALTQETFEGVVGEEIESVEIEEIAFEANDAAAEEEADDADDELSAEDLDAVAEELEAALNDDSDEVVNS